MDTLREALAGKVEPFTASRLGELREADAVVGRFLLGGQSSSDWVIYRSILEHTPWRSTEIDWYVRTPHGPFAVQSERPRIEYEDELSHDFGLLFTSTVASVLHVPRCVAMDLSSTVHQQMFRLLAPRFCAGASIDCSEEDLFPCVVQPGSEFTTIEWTTDRDELFFERGESKRPVKEYLEFRDREGAFLEERKFRWLDPAHTEAIEHAQTILSELVKSGDLGAKFARRLHGDRLVAIHSRELKIVVWLESAYLDHEIRGHRDFRNLRKGNIVLVAEDDRLIADPEKVAMRIRKPIAFKLKAAPGLRARSTRARTRSPANGLAPHATNSHAELVPEVKLTGAAVVADPVATTVMLSGPPGDLLSPAETERDASAGGRIDFDDVNTVTFSGVLRDRILFVEAERTDGRAEFSLELERPDGEWRDLVACTSFGGRALSMLRQARVGDRIVVNGEIRAYKRQISIYAKKILAILPDA